MEEKGAESKTETEIENKNKNKNQIENGLSGEECSAMECREGKWEKDQE